MKESVLEKIRKLLALAEDKSASTGEVENALKMAQRLMIKHNIEESEIELSLDDINEEFVDDNYIHGEKRYFAWDVLTTIGSAYSVRVIKPGLTKNFKYCVIGDKTSRRVTIETFQKLMPFIRSLSKQRYKEYEERFNKGNLEDMSLIEIFLGNNKTKLEKRMFYRNYMDGYILGLSNKLKKDIFESNITEEEREKWGLILIKKDDLIEEYIKESIPELKQHNGRKSNYDLSVVKIGKQDGEEQNASERLH